MEDDVYFLKYRLFAQGELREIRFHGATVEYFFAGSRYEFRHPRRLCDFMNTVLRFKREGYIIIEENLPFTPVR